MRQVRRRVPLTFWIFHNVKEKVYAGLGEFPNTKYILRWNFFFTWVFVCLFFRSLPYHDLVHKKMGELYTASGEH